MPRKTNYRVYHDEDCDIYDDYEDFDDGHDTEEYGKLSQSEKMVGNSSCQWRCFICGYDNDESSLNCETCGVIQNLSNISMNGGSSNKRTSSGALSNKEGVNFGSDLEHNGKISQLWQCSICTYENDECSLLCDICGVIRHPSNNNSSRSNIKKPSNGALAHKEVNFGGGLEQKASTSSSTNGQKEIMKYLPDDIECPSSPLSDVSQLNVNKSSTCKNIEDRSHSLVHHPDNNEGSTNRSKVNSHDQYKPEKWMLLGQEQGSLSQLNLAIVGHVDSGKSTLSGRLLHLLGRISKKDMHKNKKEAEVQKKGSFAYAWAMDESAEERERGITMTVAVAYFDSKNYHVVLLDSPGHKDFVPNMISGATQADAAILVVDASKGSFEAGMDGNGIGQTKEHAQLIRSFGVEQVIIAVNKMDVVDYSKERFEFIKNQLGSFLRSCGFKESSLTWIPVSSIENQNLVATSSDIRLSCWFQGLCLLDAIDSLQPPPRDISKPLRLPICDVTRSQSGQMTACGKLEAGAIQNGSKVLVLPSGELATIRSIERDSHASNIARAGDNVAVGLHGIDWANVTPGGILCHPDFPVNVANCLELKIVILNVTMPILVGSQVELHIHHAKGAARVVKIISLLNPKTGKVSKVSPRILKAKQSAIIELAVDRAVCVELYSNSRALGRAFLRSSGNTIAVGVVTRIVE